MILGLLLAFIGGSVLSVQGIFNSRVSERAGTWTTTTLVLGMGFLASLTIGLMLEGKQLFDFSNMKPWYWISGVIGVGVVISLVQGMKLLGPTYAISIVMTSEIGFALLWDSLGWLGLDKVPFTFNKLLGVLVIVGGILVLKLGGRREKQGSSEKSR